MAIKSVTFNAPSQYKSKEPTSKLLRQHKMWNVHSKSDALKQGGVESSPEFYLIGTIRNVDQEDHKQFYKEVLSSESYETCIRDDYENIHRNCPGLFWDIIIMDNNDAAFLKLKKIIKNIVNSQKSLKPLYDIDFTNNVGCRLVKKKIESVFQQIAPHQLFN